MCGVKKPLILTSLPLEESVCPAHETCTSETLQLLGMLLADFAGTCSYYINNRVIGFFESPHAEEAPGGSKNFRSLFIPGFLSPTFRLCPQLMQLWAGNHRLRPGLLPVYCYSTGGHSSTSLTANSNYKLINNSSFFHKDDLDIHPLQASDQNRGPLTPCWLHIHAEKSDQRQK